MKNLIVLLASFLLVSGANAGLAEFNTPSQTTEWQDFQVAHGCEIITEYHVPGGITNHVKHGILGRGGKDGNGHNEFARCVDKSFADACGRMGRVVNLRVPGKAPKCGEHCRDGLTPGKGGDSWTCKGTCPAGSFPQIHGCTSLAELNDYCKKQDSYLVYGVAQNKCVSGYELNKYCKAEFGKAYNKDTAKCEPCPAGTFPQERGCTTLTDMNTYCASTNSAFVYGVAQDACVSVFDLRKYCREEFDKGYNKDTAKCEVCPVDHFPQESGCVSKANLDKYCEGEYRTSYNPKEDRCWLPRELY